MGFGSADGVAASAPACQLLSSSSAPIAPHRHAPRHLSTPRTTRPGQRGTHLFVCQHGLWGSTDDVGFLESYLRHNGWHTLNARCNSARLTYGAWV